MNKQLLSKSNPTLMVLTPPTRPQHVWYVEYYSVPCAHGVKSDILLGTGLEF